MPLPMLAAAAVVAAIPAPSPERLRADVEALGVERPAILVRLLANMAGELAERLHIANAEIRALER